MLRRTMPLVRTGAQTSSLVGKLAAYRQIIEQRLCWTHWGISSQLVLTITTDPIRHQGILNKLGEAAHPAVLFKSIELRRLAVPLPDLLTSPWDRPGLPPINIAAAR